MLRFHSKLAFFIFTVKPCMNWREIQGKRYLIRTSTTGGQKSLGPESPESECSRSQVAQRL